MRREAGSPKILVSVGLWKLIIPELRVLVLTKRHVGSGNEFVVGPAVVICLNSLIAEIGLTCEET